MCSGCELRDRAAVIEMRIPFAETRNYVERVIENLQVYRKRFGDSTGTIEPNLHRAAMVELSIPH
jgi:hypothetical protein